MQKERKNKLESGLGSGNEEKILAALEDIKSAEAEKLIPLLLRLLKESDSYAIQTAVKDLLRSAKTGSLISILIQEIDSSDTKDRRNLIALCWECGQNADKHLRYFVDLAIHEPFENALEAITVVEEMNGNFDLNLLQECISDVKKATSEQPEKASLLSTLTAALKNFAEPENLN